MKQNTFSFARAATAVVFGGAIVWGAMVMPASAQQPTPSAALPTTVSGALSPAAPLPATAPATPAAVAATAPAASTAAGAPPVGGAPDPAAQAAAAAPPVAAAPNAPSETNPFSNVKPVDNQAVKQELPVLEQRLQKVESQMSAIQQVQVALPADALGGPRGPRTPGGPTEMDPQAMEIETATFVACVNGQAMFRDSDQKPFFVDAKEANQNEAIRRIGGCKH